MFELFCENNCNTKIQKQSQKIDNDYRGTLLFHLSYIFISLFSSFFLSSGLYSFTLGFSTSILSFFCISPISLSSIFLPGHVKCMLSFSNLGMTCTTRWFNLCPASAPLATKILVPVF